MKLLICIVPRHRGDSITQVIKKAGAGGATVMFGRGTARNQIIELLGLADTSKELVYTLVQNEQRDAIWNAVVEAGKLEKKGFGIVFELDVMNAFKANEEIIDKGADMKDGTHTLISIIVNSGYADDVMAAARKAGASGGTIINARGTGKEDDAKFFGITIVPEKEMLLILAEKGKAAEIVDAVKSLPCLAAKGSGVTYCIDVESFQTLGGGDSAK